MNVCSSLDTFYPGNSPRRGSREQKLEHHRLTKTSFLFSQVFDDCHWAIRLNENSFKARLYRAKAHKELEDMDKYEECRKELDEMFPQHEDLIKYFLDKKEGYDDEDEN